MFSVGSGTGAPHPSNTGHAPKSIFPPGRIEYASLRALGTPAHDNKFRASCSETLTQDFSHGGRHGFTRARRNCAEQRCVTVVTKRYAIVSGDEVLCVVSTRKVCRSGSDGSGSRHLRERRLRRESSSRRRPGTMAEGRNNTTRLAGVIGATCRGDLLLFCWCSAVGETPATAPSNRLNSFGPRSPIAPRRLQAGDALRHPRPWVPAFGGMTTFDVTGSVETDDSRRARPAMQRRHLTTYGQAPHLTYLHRPG